jgi:hypothetical protein
MMKTIALSLVLLTAQAQADGGYTKSRGGILIPRSQIQAGSFSELSNFDSEFCGENDMTDSKVKQICFGRLRLLNQSSLAARAFLFSDANGEKALFVEKELPKVELKSLEFGILGPLNGARLNVAAEVGRARLAIDARGEVSSVEILTQKWGRLKVTRPQN